MTSQTQDRDRNVEEAVETAVGSVARIGRLWAVYGLEIGRAALRTSSETLRATSEVLGALARALEPEQPVEGASDAEPAPSATEQPA